MSNQTINLMVRGLRGAMRSYSLQWRSWTAQANQTNADFALRRAIHWRNEAANRKTEARQRMTQRLEISR